MKVYISGRVTDTDNYMERFAEAEAFLTAKGYEVVNPVKENAKLPQDTTWRQYMGESLRMMLGCDAVYMLRGWSGSKGATLELHVAERCKMDTMFEVANE